MQNLNGTHLKVIQKTMRELGGGRRFYMVLSRENPGVPLADLFGVVVGINGVPQRIVDVEFFGGVGDSGSPSEAGITVENVYG